ncbi:CLUMA_CG000940, isoform A [Clunio marinus]|uniref:CLUMA_CG000940, isoform A n=1 Tax=Clunio marinus TaxID=568069 RepID=A0A1J1HGX4_9DIPT|nr:CLUMA_CG000940, isoform A [Clunio marinus]
MRAHELKEQQKEAKNIDDENDTCNNSHTQDNHDSQISLCALARDMNCKHLNVTTHNLFFHRHQAEQISTTVINRQTDSRKA